MELRIALLLLIGGLVIVSYLIHRDYRNPSFIYCSFWFVLVFMFSLRLWGLYDTTDLPFICIAIGCMSFFVGSLLVKGGKKGQFRNRGKDNETDFVGKRIFVLFIIASAFFIRKDILSLGAMAVGVPFEIIRYGGIFSSTDAEDLMVKFVSRPVCAAITCMGLTQLLLGEKNAGKNCLMGSILMIQSIFYDGIFVMFEFLLSAVIVSYMLFAKVGLAQLSMSIKKVKKVKKTLVILLIIGVIGLFIAKGSIFETLYMHLVPSINFMEARIEQMDEGRSLFTFEYTYGVATLQGILRPIMGILKIFGVESHAFMSATDFLLDNHEYVINIAYGEQFNFYTTCFAFYYKDFGMAGVFIFPFIYGFICQRVYVEMIKKYSARSIALYIFLVGGVFITVKFSLFSHTELIVGLYWLFFCYRSRRKDKKRVALSGIDSQKNKQYHNSQI